MNNKIERIDLPIKRRTASRKTTMLGEVHYMALAGTSELAADQRADYILINRPTYVVLVDQYAVDIGDLTPEQRESARKTLQGLEIPESHIRSGVLKMVVVAEEGDDATERDQLF